MEQIDELVKELSKEDGVRAIVLGGSRATQIWDENSDYDIYVYVDQEIEVNKRRKRLEKYCSYLEMDNQYWELEDDCKLHSGVIVEFIYRNLESFENKLKETMVECKAEKGYTTCMWYHHQNSVVLFEKEGCYSDLVHKYQIEYPEKLRQNIITLNRQLLEGKIPSFMDQIVKADKRGDKISVNHRVTEFLSSYFDLLFAFNKLAHPGEKRMLEYSLKNARFLPACIEYNLNRLLSQPSENQKVELILQDIIYELDQMLRIDSQFHS